jgi:hypothetical protein
MHKIQSMIKHSWLFILSLLLVSCGGGAGGSLPVVTDIQFDQLKYGQTSTFKLLGMNLTQDFQVSVSNCTGLAVLKGGSDTEQYVSCTPNAVGVGQITPKTKDGGVMMVKNFDIPNPQVKISSNFGDMIVELNALAAPLTVNNYLKYVNANFYNNTIFHRLIAQFVVQGGWLSSGIAEQVGAGAPIALESNNGLKNTRGSIGMARTSAPNSATTQFYFNLVDNPKLDYQSETAPGYAVFGRIVEGLAVIDIMAQITTTTMYGLENFPTSTVLIKSVVQIK